MKSPRLLALALAVLLATPLATELRAQGNRPVTDVIVAPGRTAVEEGALDYFHLTRSVLGARSRGMGGAGLAMRGDIDLYSLNPAAVLGMERWTVKSEARLSQGSGSVSDFPEELVLGVNPGTGDPITLSASDYRVSPGMEFDYSYLSVGMPVTFFGGRGTLGLSYRRDRQSPQKEETRFEGVGPVTQDIPATIGIGQTPDGGYDAITVTAAREFGPLSLGANLNFLSGTLSKDVSLGAAVFGQVQAAGGGDYSQDVSATNLDVGAIWDVGRLSLGGSVFLGFDMEYDPGRYFKRPLPGQDPNAPVFQVEQQIMSYTQSVPTQFGLGGSFDVTDRFTVNADYWNQAWSNSEITRASLTAVPTYRGPTFEEDPSDTTFDITRFRFDLVQGEGSESFSANLKDNSSIRLGLQFMAKRGETLSIPLWVGFRTETITLPQTAVPDPYGEYNALVVAWWKYVHRGEDVPSELEDVLDPDDIDEALTTVLESNQMVFRTENTTATTISFGAGVTWHDVSFEMAVETRSYDWDRPFFQQFDPTILETEDGVITGPINPFATKTRESRRQTSISFGAKLSF